MLGDRGVGMASSDVEEAEITGANTGDGLAVAIQPQTAEVLVTIVRADGTPQAPTTQSCTIDCSAVALEYWQA